MGFLSKAWKGIKNGFKKIGKAIKSGFQKFGKFMGKFGMLGSLAMSMILPGIGGMLLKGLGNNVFNLGLQTAAGQTGVTFSQFTNALISKGGSRAALGHTLNFGGSIIGKVTAPIRSVTEGITTILKTGANAIGVNVFEPIAKTIGIDNYEGQYFKEGLGEAAQQGKFFGESGGFASAYKNSRDVLRTAYGPKPEGVADTGDTLSEIAAQNKTSIDSLMKANPQITDQDVIRAGDTLNFKLPEDVYPQVERVSLPEDWDSDWRMQKTGLESSDIPSGEAAAPELNTPPLSLLDKGRNFVSDAFDSATESVREAPERLLTEIRELPGDIIDDFGKSITTTAKDAVFGKEDEAFVQAYNPVQFQTERDFSYAASMAQNDMNLRGSIDPYVVDNDPLGGFTIPMVNQQTYASTMQRLA
jgi:LysM repeat protein